MQAGLVLDVLIMIRVVAAVVRGERNNHWIIYLLMAAWSVIWIPTLFHR
jgi:hypothetical protein